MEVEKFPRYRGLLLPLLVALLAVPTSVSVLVGAAAGVRRWYDDSDMMISIRRSKNEAKCNGARSSDRHRSPLLPFSVFCFFPSFLFVRQQDRCSKDIFLRQNSQRPKEEEPNNPTRTTRRLGATTSIRYHIRMHRDAGSST